MNKEVLTESWDIVNGLCIFKGIIIEEDETNYWIEIIERKNWITKKWDKYTKDKEKYPKEYIDTPFEERIKNISDVIERIKNEFL